MRVTAGWERIQTLSILVIERKQRPFQYADLPIFTSSRLPVSRTRPPG